jgi:hypothetical protein
MQEFRNAALMGLVRLTASSPLLLLQNRAPPYPAVRPKRAPIPMGSNITDGRSTSYVARGSVQEFGNAAL